MKSLKYIFIHCLLCILSIGYSQDFLTQSMYTDDFSPIMKEKEEEYAEKLFLYSLQSMVDKEIISRFDMKGMALPLGIHNDSINNVNFTKGMTDMWFAKIQWLEKKDSLVRLPLAKKALTSIQRMSEKNELMTLRTYRQKVILPAITQTIQVHEQKKSVFSENRRKFMDLILSQLSPNVVLGYNIQELIPPTHWDWESKQLKVINPLFKAFYFDLLLQEGGTALLEGFPARYDKLLSFGPFQMTNNAIMYGINNNIRLFDEFKAYENTLALKTIDDHASVATYLAYHNWEVLSFKLNKYDSLMTKFLDYYQDVDTNTTKKRSLQILIAGLTACMHHSPQKAQEALIYYLKTNEELFAVHYNLLEMSSMNKQLRKYYRSSAEVYLVMKVYDRYEHWALDKYLQNYFKKEELPKKLKHVIFNHINTWELGKNQWKKISFQYLKKGKKYNSDLWMKKSYYGYEIKFSK